MVLFHFITVACMVHIYLAGILSGGHSNMQIVLNSIHLGHGKISLQMYIEKNVMRVLKINFKSSDSFLSVDSNTEEIVDSKTFLSFVCL